MDKFRYAPHQVQFVRKCLEDESACFDGSIVEWLLTEVERLRKIEDAARNQVHASDISEATIVWLKCVQKALDANPRPDSTS